MELIPSSDGDPLLEPTQIFPKAYDWVVLSSEAARRLQVNVGDSIRGSIVRQYKGQRERVYLDLHVAAIASPQAHSRAVVFVSEDLLLAVEDFRDGRAVPALQWKGTEQASGPRVFPTFRLYADSIDDVITLRDRLEAESIEVKTEAAAIEVVKRIDRNLGLLFWIIAVVGLTGFVLSLGASLWANVDRKRRELSVLRLIGFRSLDIVGFPFLQSFYTAVFGWILACIIYISLETTINALFPERTVCLLLWEHYIAALGLTLLSALTAALLGGIQAMCIEPSEGIREG